MDAGRGRGGRAVGLEVRVSEVLRHPPRWQRGEGQQRPPGAAPAALSTSAWEPSLLCTVTAVRGRDPYTPK